MTYNEVYKLAKALVALADGENQKNYKGTIQKARIFMEHYEYINKTYKGGKDDEEE